MLGEILPNVPVTFTVVENGTNRNMTKLVSSDGYEYTKKVTSKHMFYTKSNR